jgi:hypothetical protein
MHDWNRWAPVHTHASPCGYGLYAVVVGGAPSQNIFFPRYQPQGPQTLTKNVVTRFMFFSLSVREQTCDDTRADTLGVCARAADYIVDVEKGCRV